MEFPYYMLIEKNFNLNIMLLFFNIDIIQYKKISKTNLLENVYIKKRKEKIETFLINIS